MTIRLHTSIANVSHGCPIGKDLVDQVEWAANDLALIKVLDPTTNQRELAERVTVDILA